MFGIFQQSYGSMQRIRLKQGEYEYIPLRPVLSNFHIKSGSGEEGKIYFDTNRIVTASPGSAGYQGFVVSGKTVDGLFINGGALTGHYFTVSTDFDFWDNNTIRYEGEVSGSESDLQDLSYNNLYDFTMEHIVNNIAEPSASTLRYASAAGSGAGTGLDTSNEWTLAEAFASASAGMTIYVKAGVYTPSALRFRGVGTSTNPIKVIGYKTTPGDITSNYWDYGSGSLDSTEMPLMSGSSVDSTYLWYMDDAHYSIFENFGFTNAKAGIDGEIGNLSSEQSDNLIFRRFNVDEMGSATTGYASFFTLSNRDETIPYEKWTNLRIQDCRGQNVSGHFVVTAGDGNCLIEECKFYSDRTATPQIFDYFIAPAGNHNIIKNNYCENKSAVNASLHGIGIRGAWRLENEYNLIVDNECHGTKEDFYVRNAGCNYNVIKRNIASNNGLVSFEDYGAFWIWTDSNYNVFEQNSADGHAFGIGWKNNNEQGQAIPAIGTGNIIRNNLISNVKYVHYFYSTIANSWIGDNYIYNNTFYNADFITKQDGSNVIDSGSLIHTNNIFIDITADNATPYTSRSFENNVFFNCGTWADTYIGSDSNIEVNPELVDPANGNFQLSGSSPTSVTEGGIYLTGSRYDYVGTQRISGSSAIGAYEYVAE